MLAGVWRHPGVGTIVAKEAAAIIQKPVFGRKRTLTYTTTITRNGEEVEAVVVEDRSAQVGPIGAALLALGAALGVGAAATVVSGTAKRLANREAVDPGALPPPPSPPGPQFADERPAPGPGSTGSVGFRGSKDDTPPPPLAPFNASVENAFKKIFFPWS